MRGKPSRPARLKEAAEDNLLMAEVVDDVEIDMGGGGFQRRIEFLSLIFLMNASLGWMDRMRMFIMVRDVGKGMVGVNGKVLPGYF